MGFCHFQRWTIWYGTQSWWRWLFHNIYCIVYVWCVFLLLHPAGDVTRVSVMQRKVTVKIGDAEKQCRRYRDKNRWKRAIVPVSLALSRVSFKSAIRPIKCQNVLSLLVKPKLKNLLPVLRYRLPRLRGKGQNQHAATFWHHNSIKIDRLNYKLFPFGVHSEARTRLNNLTKIQSSNAWISSWNVQMVHFPLCRESVLGMPRIEIEFWVWYGLLFWHKFGTVCCFLHLDLPSTQLHDLLKVIVL